MINPEVIMQGLGAELHVDADTPQFRELFRTLGTTGLKTVDPEGLHITLVDPAHTIIPIISVRDAMAIDRARSEAGMYLSNQIGKGLRLTPDFDRLLPYGDHRRKVGIKIAQQGLLNDLREDVLDIFNETAGIRLNKKFRKPYSGHVVLGIKNENYRKLSEEGSPFKHNRHKVPAHVWVRGFGILDRVKGEPLDEDTIIKLAEEIGYRNDTRYRNKPKSVRRV